MPLRDPSIFLDMLRAGAVFALGLLLHLGLSLGLGIGEPLNLAILWGLAFGAIGYATYHRVRTWPPRRRR